MGKTVQMKESIQKNKMPETPQNSLKYSWPIRR